MLEVSEHDASGCQTLALHARQAVSILYKTRLPLLLVFNKVDVMAHDFAVAWMKDYEAFRAAIAADSTYAAELSRSLCLARLAACTLTAGSQSHGLKFNGGLLKITRNLQCRHCYQLHSKDVALALPGIRPSKPVYQRDQIVHGVTAGL